MTHPVLSFPALDGMAYPRLEGIDAIRFVAPMDIAGLSVDTRQAVRVLMTSASRGFTREMSELLPNLAFVTSQGAGLDKIDTGLLAERGIRLRPINEAVTEDVADLAMTFSHMLLRNLLNADKFARSGAWENGRFPLGESVVGKTIGIAGLSGRIGQAIAQRATASKMMIAGLDRPSNQGLNATLLPDWVSLAAASDVLVLAVPGDPALHHVINETVLAALGSQGYLVNVGRGGLVDTAALTCALQNGVIAGAALDVLEEEPHIPPALRDLPNVIFSPHVGAQTWGQRARAAKIAEDEVLAFLAG